METNKAYFVKYLPVEGNIEEGDKVLVSRPMGAFIGTIINNKIVSDNNVLVYPMNEVEKVKVKLFLCSRDIKPEDYLKEGNVHIYHDGSEPPFKVIGEILTSNIKEGQEFTEKIAEFGCEQLPHFNKCEDCGLVYFSDERCPECSPMG